MSRDISTPLPRQTACSNSIKISCCRQNFYYRIKCENIDAPLFYPCSNIIGLIQAVIENLFDGFALLIAIVPVKQGGPVLKLGVSGLWSHLWRNRSRYDMWTANSYDTEHADENDTGLDAQSGIVMLLLAYQGLYTAVSVHELFIRRFYG